jgi:glycosyltransferase involved in cell wall biosynthesis
MQSWLRRFSALLQRGHKFIDRRLEAKTVVPPRLLKYQTKTGAPTIIHFNGNFVIGGTSQLIADLVERTSEKYDHHIIVPKHPRPLPYQPLSITEYSLAQMPLLYEWLEKQKPSLVHIHYWVRPMHRYYDFGLWYEALFKICEDLQLKVIQNVNVPTHPFPGSSVTHNVFVSHYLQKEFNNSQTPATVIYPGSDMQHFSGSNEGLSSNTIGMVYRLDSDKLNKEAIEVFIAAAKKKKAIHCYIVGGGYFLDYYKQRVKAEGLAQQFTFTGFVSYDSLPDHYKKIGVIVAPVHDESFGQVTPFAMGMGIPVVGYDTGALSEILGSSDDLVPYGDSNALAEKAIALLSDPVRARQTGERNRDRARQLFSIEKMISEYEYLYDTHLA